MLERNCPRVISVKIVSVTNSWLPCCEISLNLNLKVDLAYRFCFSRHVFPPGSVAQIIGPSAIYIGFTAHVPPLGVLGLAGEPANFESTNGVSVFVLKWLKKRRPGQPHATPRPSFLSTV
jgi:hypothetical protein